MAARPIRALDATTVDQIAAGEVVERPASVVKELVENALDSGAGRIEVTIEQGGLEAITVADDGCGMAAADVALAVSRHATSKMAALADLDQLTSYGFRGEALSSIASISRFTLVTRRPEDDVALRLVVHGGQRISQEPCGAPPGTSLQVRDLFYNVPARRKFMRAATTEQAHVQEALLRTFLGARRASLGYTAGKRRLLDLATDCPDHERPARLLGKRVRALMPFVAARGATATLRISGYLSPPALARGEGYGTWLFVNGRYVRDRMLQRAALEGYQLVFADAFPTALVYVDLAPGDIDVNVHPQKLEVRFSDAQAVFREVRDAVAIAAAKLQRQASGGAAAVTRAEISAGTAPPAGRPFGVEAPASPSKEKIEPEHARATARARVLAACHGHAQRSAQVAPTTVRPARAAGRAEAACMSVATAPSAAAGPRTWTSLVPLAVAPRGYLACQRDEALLLVDLCRAHRAIAHHAFVAVGAPALHRLLLPATFAPAADLQAAVDDFLIVGADDPSGSPSGLHLQPLCPGSYLIQAVPSCFSACAPVQVAEAYFAAAQAHAVASGKDAGTQTPPSVAALLPPWLEALDACGAWPTSWRPGTSWAPRLLAALDAAQVPMRAPWCHVVISPAQAPAVAVVQARAALGLHGPADAATAEARG